MNVVGSALGNDFYDQICAVGRLDSWCAVEGEKKVWVCERMSLSPSLRPLQGCNTLYNNSNFNRNSALVEILTLVRTQQTKSFARPPRPRSLSRQPIDLHVHVLNIKRFADIINNDVSVLTPYPRRQESLLHNIMLRPPATT